jgi:trk system potassium uptake protein TrkA
MVNLETAPQLVGKMVRSLSVPGEIDVTAITRQGKAFIPLSGTEFRKGDIIHLVVLASAMDRFKALLDLGEGG